MITSMLLAVMPVLPVIRPAIKLTAETRIPCSSFDAKADAEADAAFQLIKARGVKYRLFHNTEYDWNSDTPMVQTCWVEVSGELPDAEAPRKLK